MADMVKLPAHIRKKARYVLRKHLARKDVIDGILDAMERGEGTMYYWNGYAVTEKYIAEPKPYMGLHRRRG